MAPNSDGPSSGAAAKPRTHSSLFLSGEADPDAAKRREERLGGILSGATCSGDSKPNPAVCIGGSSGGDALVRPKIQVVSEGGGSEKKTDANDGQSLDSDDEDDAPPPLTMEPSPVSQATIVKTSSNDNADDCPSLMETMMAEAARVQREKDAKAQARQRREAKSKSSFGSMKGGFLNKSSSGKSKKKGKKVQSNKEDDVFEVDSEGNLVKSANAAKEEEDEIPTIRPKNARSSGGRSEADRLRLKEVQDAMQNSSLGGMLGGSSSAAGGAGATTDQLLTGDAELMQKIASNPRLAAGMRNPKFAAAMEALQSDPVAAMERFRDHPEIGDFLREYCGVLGEHFTELGRKQEEAEAKAKKKKNQTQNGAPLTPGDSMGPLAEAAMRREQERKARGEANAPMSQDEEEMMQRIVSDPEMAEILMDPAMQIIMQECAVPGRMHAYMQHPQYGPKLRKLMEAGLLKVG